MKAHLSVQQSGDTGSVALSLFHSGAMNYINLPGHYLEMQLQMCQGLSQAGNTSLKVAGFLPI